MSVCPDSALPDPFRDGLPVLAGVACDGGALRVRLRPMRPDDAEALWTIFSDAETLRYWSHEPFASREAVSAYLTQRERGVAERTAFTWAVAEIATDALVGTVALVGWERTHRRAEVGFILHRGAWGRGYAAEAVRGVLGFAFGAMGLHRVEADVDPDNAVSLALLARLGFRAEGRLAERWFTFGAWRDSVVLGLLARDGV
ncbi:MAG TPA: GNAT family N-acetyltransferase [Rubricoccaceae bacterium]|jgi:RimJ/RimL family protein N-acetyltransferase